MKRFLLIIPFSLAVNLFAQTVSKSFELRYFTSDPRANGETDFKGETEWMNTDQRIQFLNHYADYASRFFGDPGFDQVVVSGKEVDEALTKVKPQPLTKIRQTIPLKGWKSYGYKEGEDIAQKKTLAGWQSYKGASIENGALLLDNAAIDREIDFLYWRFSLETGINLEEKSSCTITLAGDHKPAIVLKLKKGEIAVSSAGKTIPVGISVHDWFTLKIEGDFTRKRFNLIVDGNLLQYYIPMADTTVAAITRFSLQSIGNVRIDNLFLFNHIPVNNVRAPYVSSVVLDENFEGKPAVEGWQKSEFDDRAWKMVDLPSVHGGVREKGEDYYLRKKITIGSYERATLQIETVDPGGEVWINNQVVAVVDNRYPVELDVTKYLKPDSENLIAVRIKPYKADHFMGHTPSDRNIGWFLGRANLVLSSSCMIKNVLVHTASLGNPAIQSNKVHIQYTGRYYFKGSIEINYYPWFPAEGDKVASFTRDIQVRPRIENEYVFEIPVHDPALWSYDAPFLYKVEVVLKDEKGTPVDDYVTTTGIRTLEQKNGDFYLNGEPDMLNGAQIMGFRTPIETIAKYNRCAPPDIVAEELLMIKKMGANLLRMHVHAEEDITDGINDPRYAEMADQLGVCLIWQTSAWMRAGEAWHVNFEEYPQCMIQVYNHPSIVIWEASNHPNRFKEHDITDTDDYIKKIVDAISSTDQSRLISPTSFWQHTYYANYDGTLDYKGNKIKAVPEYMAEMVTRGSQDAYAGYGHEWSSIRKAPNNWAASCLAAKGKAYFNFEHEESIGQPNWNLCKGKPWYLLQSYEWDYDAGSIGRKLTADEWKASQAWQAFSAWESMKRQILLGYDGFSWCTLHGGPNMGTYKKPLIDNLGHPKLAYYVNRMVFQKTWAGSNNVDVVYGPDDQIRPVISHLGNSEKADLLIQLKSFNGKVIDKKRFMDIELKGGHSFTELDGSRFRNVPDGIYVITYDVTEHK